MLSNLGLIGLGTMGSNLAQNIASRGYRVSLWNRSVEKVEEFVRIHGEESYFGASNIEEFVESLESPRKIILMLPDGKPTQEVLTKLLAVLEKGDAVMDGANALFRLTEVNQKNFAEKGLHFLGCGISGGAEGALHGPSLMPGGTYEAWTLFEPILMKIAASDFGGKACVSYMGNGGAGHYVKMVHNGIEYAEMQSLAEAYDLLKTTYRLAHIEIVEIFRRLSRGPLQSFLMEAMVEVLEKSKDGQALVELILDKAGQKGTGTWTSQEALNLGVSTPSLTASVFARSISAEKEARLRFAPALTPLYNYPPSVPISELVPQLEGALLAARLIHFTQGFDLLRAANQAYEYHLPFGEIARVWQGGCIIRCELLKDLQIALKENPDQSLYGTAFAQNLLKKHQDELRRINALAITTGLPLFALSGALSHFDSMRRANSPANIIQTLRDRFGNHGFEWVNEPGITAHL